MKNISLSVFFITALAFHRDTEFEDPEIRSVFFVAILSFIRAGFQASRP